eukprot:jgi/Botrbrau1/10397/Bobra.0133s0006.1
MRTVRIRCLQGRYSADSVRTALIRAKAVREDSVSAHWVLAASVQCRLRPHRFGTCSCRSGPCRHCSCSIRAKLVHAATSGPLAVRKTKAKAVPAKPPTGAGVWSGPLAVQKIKAEAVRSKAPVDDPFPFWPGHLPDQCRFDQYQVGRAGITREESYVLRCFQFQVRYR